MCAGPFRRTLQASRKGPHLFLAPVKIRNSHTAHKTPMPDPRDSVFCLLLVPVKTFRIFSDPLLKSLSRKGYAINGKMPMSSNKLVRLPPSLLLKEPCSPDPCVSVLSLSLHSVFFCALLSSTRPLWWRPLAPWCRWSGCGTTSRST